MLTAVLVSGYLFKDLADISQWIIQSERTTTMWVWYNRNALAVLSLIALGVAFVIKSRHRAVVGPKVMALLTLLFTFQFYSGFINPHIMMRERQDDGLFVSVTAAKKYLAPDESVIVIEINGQARAHSDKDMLRPHIAGAGQLGGENVIMTYCGLTHLGMAVTPEIGGKQLDLRPFTQLENNLVMADRNTNEPIQQLWLQKESDVVRGNEARMREWPSFRMPFARFAEAYPEGEVFVNDYLAKDRKPGFFKNPFLAIYDPLMDVIFDHAISDQATSIEPAFPTIKHRDDRLPTKEKVWAFSIGDDYVAYTEDFVRSQGNPINVTVGDMDVVVAYDEEFESLGVFYNPTGEPIEEIDFFGNVGSGRLLRVESLKAGAYWIVWANFFPDTDINRMASDA